jgi:hypothetical protein
VKTFSEQELMEWADMAVKANGALPTTVEELAQFFDYFQIILAGEQPRGLESTSTRRHRAGH